MINDDPAFRERLKRAYGSEDAASGRPATTADPADVVLTPDEVRQARQEQEQVRARLRSAR